MPRPSPLLRSLEDCQKLLYGPTVPRITWNGKRECRGCVSEWKGGGSEY